MFLKIAAQAFAAGDSLNIFLRFLGFWGSFSYKIFSYKKACMLIRSKINVSKGLQITNFKLWDEWLYLLVSAHKTKNCETNDYICLYLLIKPKINLSKRLRIIKF